MPSHIAPDLPVSRPADPAEREAEAMAEKVMRAPAGTNGLETRRSPSTMTSTSGGRHLDSGVRRFMEPQFNYDFSGVRVHTDGAATQSASGLNARAYTVGQNIYFGQGQYQPDTADGQQLLAHELTHVIQQSGSHQAPDVHVRTSPMIHRDVRFSSKAPLAIDHWTAGATTVAGDWATTTTGDFEASAEVHVDADTAAELAGWEVGFLQNDQITWDRSYYTRGNADGQGKFLERKLVVPDKPLKDHFDETSVWADPNNFSYVDAAAVFQGGGKAADITLTHTDEPHSKNPIHGATWTSYAPDGRDNISELRFGDNFVTFISAHNSVTDEWRHLELVYWTAQVSVDFTPAKGGGVAVTRDERVLDQTAGFRWTPAADQPARGSQLANKYVRDLGNYNISRVDGWD